MSADHKDRVYRFHFLKDRFWIWAVVLPFGLITWSLPFIILWGLRRAGETPDWFPWLMFFVLGIPSYMIGWIFVYSLM